MRKLFSILTVLLFSAVGFADIESKHDRFRDTTKISTNITKLALEYNCREQPRLHLMMTFTGKIMPKTKPEVQMMFVSKAEDWQYLNCHFTDMLIDGKPLKISETRHDGSVISADTIMEYIMTSVSWKEFCKMAIGKKIEVKICNTEFILSTREMKDISEFHRIAKEWRSYL